VICYLGDDLFKVSHRVVPKLGSFTHVNCPKIGIVCDTPTYTQSRGVVFLVYLRRYGC